MSESSITVGRARKIKSLTIATKKKHANGLKDTVTFFTDTGRIEAYVDGESITITTLDINRLQTKEFDVLLELEDT